MVNDSLNPITEYLATLIRDGKIDAISINAEQMGEAIASLRCGEIRYNAEVAKIIGRCVGVCARLIVLEGKAEEHATKCIENLLQDLAPYLRTTEPEVTMHITDMTGKTHSFPVESPKLVSVDRCIDALQEAYDAHEQDAKRLNFGNCGCDWCEAYRNTAATMLAMNPIPNNTLSNDEVTK